MGLVHPEPRALLSGYLGAGLRGLEDLGFKIQGLRCGVITVVCIGIYRDVQR